MATVNPKIPEPTKTFKHVTPIQLRFNDIDIFSHVNNAVYIQFYDLGKLRYFEDVLGKDFTKKGFTAVVVNINCNFFSPSFIDERLEVLTAVIAIGEKSITLEQRIVNAETNDIKTTCTTIMSGFDPTTFKSASIPIHFRNIISTYETE